MENKIEELENRINQLETIISSLLNEHKKIVEKQEKENTLVYEHLQFMNYSQKIKNLENEIREIKSNKKPIYEKQQFILRPFNL